MDGDNRRIGACWHPCRGAFRQRTGNPAVSLRSTTGYRLGSLRLPWEDCNLTTVESESVFKMHLSRLLSKRHSFRLGISQ